MSASGLRWLTALLLLAGAYALRLDAAEPKNGPPLLAPQLGYIHPSGGRVGTTVDVVLAGYDWTPDMEFLVLDDGVEFEVIGPISKNITAEPPYWFGPKSFERTFKIPREVPARIRIAPNRPPGPIRWHAANANGVSTRGVFLVSDTPEVVEERHRRGAQDLPTLPVTVSGQVLKIEEVDLYRFRTPAAGVVTCELFARRLGSPLSAALQVRDAMGEVVVDVVDTEIRDLSASFTARAGGEYVVRLHDLDFAGNRSFVYRLHLSQGPRIVGALPAYGQRGTIQDVELIGYGIKSGRAKLESVVKTIAFPKAADSVFHYELETLSGSAHWDFPLTDNVERHASGLSEFERAKSKLTELSANSAVTATLPSNGTNERYRLDAMKGDTWVISLEGVATLSPLDLALKVFGPDGKQVAKNDDFGKSTDARLTLTAPSDGTYEVEASDLSASPRTIASIYRLAACQPKNQFSVSIPEKFTGEIGGKVNVEVTVDRIGGFAEPIQLSFEGLPRGMANGFTASEEMILAPGEMKKTVRLLISEDASTKASVLFVRGTARAGKRTLQIDSNPLVFGATMKSLAKVTPVDREGGRTVHRGTTYPAMVFVDRFHGYEGSVLLQMSAVQGRHRQGIEGGEVVVPAGKTHVPYPCYMPEWLETNRTSRMLANAMVEAIDPQGNKRWLSTKMDGRITISLEGALMSLSNDVHELIVTPGATIKVPLSLHRSPKLQEAAQLELVPGPRLEGLLHAEPVELGIKTSQTTFRVRTSADPRLVGHEEFVIRAVAFQDGRYPAIAHTTVKVEFAAATAVGKVSQ